MSHATTSVRSQGDVDDRRVDAAERRRDSGTQVRDDVDVQSIWRGAGPTAKTW